MAKGITGIGFWLLVVVAWFALGNIFKAVGSHFHCKELESMGLPKQLNVTEMCNVVVLTVLIMSHKCLYFLSGHCTP